MWLTVVGNRGFYPIKVRTTGGCDLRLLSSVKDVSAIPTAGNNLIIVALVDHVIHFRIFDDDGNVVVNTDGKKLANKSSQIAALARQLDSLWPPHELTWSEEGQAIAAVTSIVGHISPAFKAREKEQAYMYGLAIDKRAMDRSIEQAKSRFQPIFHNFWIALFVLVSITCILMSGLTLIFYRWWRNPADTANFKTNFMKLDFQFLRSLLGCSYDSEPAKDHPCRGRVLYLLFAQTVLAATAMSLSLPVVSALRSEQACIRFQPMGVAISSSACFPGFNVDLSGDVVAGDHNAHTSLLSQTGGEGDFSPGVDQSMDLPILEAETIPKSSHCDYDRRLSFHPHPHDISNRVPKTSSPSSGQ